jgi:tRNA pseudouridine38-40 synthase
MLTFVALMPRYFARITYDGTAYNGWQVQENTPRTIQQVMNERISGLLNERIEFTGCGRTDTGVHAKEFYAHFDAQRELVNTKHDTPSAQWTYKFNCVLPPAIAVHEILKVRDDAHARYDAVSRTYEYIITQKRDPFMLNRACFIYTRLDIGAMNRASKALLGYTDFSCFSKSRTQVKTNNCRIMKAGWKKKGDLLIFTITADRFLRNMVRAIVGTMVEIGKGKIGMDDLRRIIEGKKRSDAGMSVEAQGLYLVKVRYKKGMIRKVRTTG